MDLHAISRELRQYAERIRTLQDLPPAERARRWSRPLDGAGELLREAIGQGALDDDARLIVDRISAEDLAKKPKIVYLELANRWLSQRYVETRTSHELADQAESSGEPAQRRKYVHIDSSDRCRALAKSLDLFADEITKTPSPEISSPDELVSVPQLATRYAIPLTRLRGRLDTFRSNNVFVGWKEVENREANAPKYLYRLGSVLHICKALQQKICVESESKK